MIKYLVVLVVVLVGFLIVVKLSEKSDIAHCLKLVEQAKEYEDFFMADWEKSMCDHYNIKI